MRSGDIRDQSRKLSEKAPNFGRFLPFQILGGRPSKSYSYFITHASRDVAWKNFCEDTPTCLEVIGAHTLNFRPNFKFSRLNFYGDPRRSGRPPNIWKGKKTSKIWSFFWQLSTLIANISGTHRHIANRKTFYFIFAVAVCTSMSWSICNACKNLRGQHPQGPKCSLPQNVRLGGSVWAPITLLSVDQSSPNFFIQHGRGCSW